MLVFQSKELTSAECCRPAHSKVQANVLRDSVKPGAAAPRLRSGEKPLTEVFQPKYTGALFSYQTILVPLIYGDPEQQAPVLPSVLWLQAGRVTLLLPAVEPTSPGACCCCCRLPNPNPGVQGGSTATLSSRRATEERQRGIIQRGKAETGGGSNFLQDMASCEQLVVG
eukprot:g30888.t1